MSANSWVPRENKGGLTAMILIAIVSAILFARFAPSWAVSVHLGGEIFLRLLKMMVVPLVVSSVMSGILGMGDIRKLGKPGAAAIGYYLTTTLLAVIVGLIPGQCHSTWCGHHRHRRDRAGVECGQP